MLKTVALSLALLLTSVVSAESRSIFHEVFSFSEMERYFDQADQESLVIFDIDLVLLIPAEPALQMPNMIRHRETMTQHYKSHHPDVRAAILRLMISEFGQQLVEEGSVASLLKLQERGVPTMAFTASWTGGGLAEARWSHLANYQIDFSSLLPERERIVFDTYTEAAGGFPAYYRGILFTNGDHPSKGELLLKFLDRVDCSPHHILFIDDRKENLDSVGEVLSERGVDHTLLWYRGANHFQSKEVTAEEMARVWGGLVERAKEMTCPIGS